MVANFVGMMAPDDLAPVIGGLDALIVSNDFYTADVARLVHDHAPLPALAAVEFHRL